MAPAGGTLPNLVVIGAMKCGTSALHYYLDLHPEIQMSSPKELGFFAAEAVVEGPLATAAESEQRIMRGGGRNWERGIEWYAGHFDPAASVRGEASPAYTAPWFPRSAELIASILPDTRLIFMVRDPLEQIVSQYLHYRHAGNEPRELNEAVADPHGIYVERARYHARLQPFLERFPEERILVLSQEELLHRRRQALTAAFGFLAVDAAYWSPKMERRRHRSGGKGWRARLLRRIQLGPFGRIGYMLPQEAKWYVERLFYGGESRERERPALTAQTRERITAALGDDVARLRALTGKSLGEWSM